MEPRYGFRNDALSEAPPRPRRLSMEEDVYYRELMTQRVARPPRPPSYGAATGQPFPGLELPGYRPPAPAQQPEILPGYSSDIHIEGVFMRKMEIEDTIKRAEYRNWHMVYVVLQGTALNIYQVKKDRAWWSSRSDGPNVSPDNPPWVKKASLENAYSLLHADAGIAADYRKRRYVIRMRAGADQFLLSCVELPTFVNWLDNLFAAMAIAAPIDERDFPRDQSIPRMQRVRWMREQQSLPEDSMTGFSRSSARRASVSPMASTGQAGDGDAADLASSGVPDPITEVEETPATIGPSTGHPVTGRLSTTSYPNESVDPDTGKWTPRHAWTQTHDHLYAKLCFSVLLFKSPRKSNYIIVKGKQWYVDWATGRMAQALPPAYGEIDSHGEIDSYGPWHVVTTENRRL